MTLSPRTFFYRTTPVTDQRILTMPTHTSSTLDHAAAAKPVARITPTSRGFVPTTTIVTLLAFTSAFTISGFSQVWAGEELGLPV